MTYGYLPEPAQEYALTYRKEEMGGQTFTERRKNKQQNKKEINKIKNIQQKDIKLIIKMCTDY